MARRPPETTRLIRRRSLHISFAVHMRELAKEKKHFVYWLRRKLNNLFLKQERVSQLITFLGTEFQVFGPFSCYHAKTKSTSCFSYAIVDLEPFYKQECATKVNQAATHT